ncbi:hypothetical protein [Amycolatopsis sp. lyj-109]|uniref:hypothetical protein n=1 Tax=Amycolatopsis sp. lyj-109 TaxID=2789287 RepID=UPI003979E345
MGDDNEDLVTISHFIDRMTRPASRAESFSAGEILDRAATLREMRASLPAHEQAAVLAQLPHGHAEGYESFAASFQAGHDRLAGNHRRRLQLLKSAEVLPYLAYAALLRQTTKTNVKSAESDLIADLNPGGAADAAKARTLVQLIKVLLLLSSAGQRTFLITATPLLLFLLLDLLPALHGPAPSEGGRRTTERVSRPPGRDLRSKPRVARGPGHVVPLAVPRSEGRVGPCAFGGAL